MPSRLPSAFPNLVSHCRDPGTKVCTSRKFGWIFSQPHPPTISREAIAKVDFPKFNRGIDTKSFQEVSERDKFHGNCYLALKGGRGFQRRVRRVSQLAHLEGTKQSTRRAYGIPDRLIESLRAAGVPRS